jgi:putative ABC transport system permease protein
MSPERYPDDIAIWNFQRSLLERVRSVPGVSYAGVGEELPVAGGYGCTVQGFSDASVFARIEAAGMTTCAGQEVVSPGYFEALGIPLVEGRYLDDGDNDDPGRASVVVSRAFAERFWPGENALGKGVNPGGRTVEPYYHVVGVVGDVPKASDDGRAPLSQAAVAICYPVVEDPNVEGDWGSWPGVTSLVVKSDVAANTLAPAIRAAVNELDPQVPIANLQPVDDLVAAALSEVSFVSLLLAIAAGVSLLLSAVGLYGVVSYGVTARTREIGMRLAIGARPGDVRSQIVAGSMRLAAVGLAAGLVLAVGTSRALAGLVVGLEPSGWGTYTMGLALLAVVALVASWIPALRASGVDPAIALRSES